MSSANGTRCCAKCKTPYGHAATAGRCCHPSDHESAQRELAVLERALDAVGSETHDREDER